MEWSAVPTAFGDVMKFRAKSSEREGNSWVPGCRDNFFSMINIKSTAQNAITSSSSPLTEEKERSSISANRLS